jgi:hypothetical protein
MTETLDTPLHLSPEQIAAYRETGYLRLADALPAPVTAAALPLPPDTRFPRKEAQMITRKMKVLNHILGEQPAREYVRALLVQHADAMSKEVPYAGELIYLAILRWWGRRKEGKGEKEKLPVRKDDMQARRFARSAMVVGRAATSARARRADIHPFIQEAFGRTAEGNPQSANPPRRLPRLVRDGVGLARRCGRI